MMQRSKSAALLAAIIITQPLYMRADDRSWGLWDYLCAGAAAGAGVGAVIWGLSPESEEALIKNARETLNANESLGTHQFGAHEADLKAFAKTHIAGSFDYAKTKAESARDALNSARTKLHDRLNTLSQDNIHYQEMRNLADRLEMVASTYQARINYMNKNRAYFKLYESMQASESFRKNGCTQFSGKYRTINCIDSMEKAMKDLDQKIRDEGHYSSSLLSQAWNEKDELARLHDRIKASDSYINERIQLRKEEEQQQKKQQEHLESLERERAQRAEQLAAQQRQERIDRENRERTQRLERERQERLAQLERERQERLVQLERDRADRDRQQQREQETKDRLKALDVFNQYHATMNQYYKPVTTATSPYSNTVSPQAAAEINRTVGLDATSMHRYITQLEKDTTSYIAIIKASCKNDQYSNNAACHQAVKFVDELKKLKEDIKKHSQYTNEEEFSKLKMLLEQAHRLYDPIVRASHSRMIDMIKTNGVGNHSENPLNLYLETLDTTLKNGKVIADKVCTDNQFKNCAECRDVRSYAETLARHMQEVKNSSAYEQEAAAFDKKFQEDLDRKDFVRLHKDCTRDWCNVKKNNTCPRHHNLFS